MIRLVAGAARVEWCETCLLSHAKVGIYAVSDDDADPRDYPRIGEWLDGHQGACE